MVPPLYGARDFEREGAEPDKSEAEWRKPIARDYARVLHSASFRRLQGKTQVFPGHESDFFRNRLTHSLEVAQIAEGIADRLNYVTPQFKAAHPDHKINGKLCAVAGLIHDLGHPPFGHNGERALDDAMRKHGGFEGNAQSLRIVSRLEKKVQRASGEPLGLNLTYRTLASILKYDEKIPRSRRASAKIAKGYYVTEADLVKEIRSAVAGDNIGKKSKLKTVECAIMDIADDIAYSTYDLEDSLKAGFLSPSEILSSSEALLGRVALKVNETLEASLSAKDVLAVFADIFELRSPVENGGNQGLDDFVDRYTAYRQLSVSSHFRTKLSSQLVDEAVNSITAEYNKECPALSAIFVDDKIKKRIEILKQYTFLATIYSSRVKLPEYRGYEVVSGIFEALAGERGYLLMPDDVREQYENTASDHDAQMRLVCDFVAGMTDRYAMEFFGRLHSDSAQSMFKPV